MLCAGSHKSQKRVSPVVNHLIWVIGTEPRFSARAASTLNHCDVSLDVFIFCFGFVKNGFHLLFNNVKPVHDAL